jgi:hypothetical protein
MKPTFHVHVIFDNTLNIVFSISTVKCTDSHPRIGLSECESDAKLYVVFEFCQEKNHEHLIENILIYKAKQFILTKQFKENSTYF